MKKILPFLFALLISEIAFSQTENSIDEQYENCVSDSSTTLGMCNCAIAALNEWDKVLNDNYNLLMKKLTPAAQDQLKSAQRTWISYRDAEILLIDQIYYEDMQGTMYRPMAIDREM